MGTRGGAPGKLPRRAMAPAAPAVLVRASAAAGPARLPRSPRTSLSAQATRGGCPSRGRWRCSGSPPPAGLGLGGPWSSRRRRLPLGWPAPWKLPSPRPRAPAELTAEEAADLRLPGRHSTSISTTMPPSSPSTSSSSSSSSASKPGLSRLHACREHDESGGEGEAEAPAGGSRAAARRMRSISISRPLCSRRPPGAARPAPAAPPPAISRPGPAVRGAAGRWASPGCCGCTRLEFTIAVTGCRRALARCPARRCPLQEPCSFLPGARGSCSPPPTSPRSRVPRPPPRPASPSPRLARRPPRAAGGGARQPPPWSARSARGARVRVPSAA